MPRNEETPLSLRCDTTAHANPLLGAGPCALGSVFAVGRISWNKAASAVNGDPQDQAAGGVTHGETAAGHQDGRNPFAATNHMSPRSPRPRAAPGHTRQDTHGTPSWAWALEGFRSAKHVLAKPQGGAQLTRLDAPYLALQSGLRRARKDCTKVLERS